MTAPFVAIYDPSNMTFCQSLDEIGMNVEPQDIENVKIYDSGGRELECEIQECDRSRTILGFLKVGPVFDRVVPTGIRKNNVTWSENEVKELVRSLLETILPHEPLKGMSLVELLEFGCERIKY